jgi:hypothetical protein
LYRLTFTNLRETCAHPSLEEHLEQWSWQDDQPHFNQEQLIGM